MMDFLPHSPLVPHLCVPQAQTSGRLAREPQTLIPSGSPIRLSLEATYSPSWDISAQSVTLHRLSSRAFSEVCLAPRFVDVRFTSRQSCWRTQWPPRTCSVSAP